MKWFSKGFQSFLNLCQAETRRLILVIGLMFGVILVFQYVELPYGNVLSSLFSAGKVPVPGNSRSEIVGDKSLPSDSNYNATYSGQKVPNNTRTSSFLLDRNENSKVYLGLQEDLENVDNLVVEKEAKPPEHSFIGFSTPAMPPIDSSGSLSSAHAIPLIDSSPHTDEIITSKENERPEGEQSQENAEQKLTSSSMPVVMEKNKKPEVQRLEVYTLSDMNKFLRESHVSYNSVIPRWSSPVDHELQSLKLQIENAPILKNYPDLYAPLYHNVSLFKRSYELMEKTLKVYIYREGERPILHTPVLGGIYASEGWFMKLLETNKKFVTKNPRKAHLFYLPFSSLMLKETLYVPNSHSRKNIVQYLKNYLEIIAAKYYFWNRTEGAGHFLVACHDWATSETKKYMSKCIRALCNADVKEGFVFGKDVSLPETYIRLPKNPLRDIGGKPPSKRSVLAFFAGSMHGYVRPILLQHWENKDPDMKIFGELPKSKGNMNYVNYMKSSKYCICAKGYEVNSPRVVEAIFYECVPVIISDNFVPPFFEVLNWESFAVFVMEKDIPNLKRILLSIPEKRFRQMQLRVKKAVATLGTYDIALELGKKVISQRNCQTCNGWQALRCATCKGSGRVHYQVKNCSLKSGEKATAECVADAITDNRAKLIHLPSAVDLHTSLPSKDCLTCDGTGVMSCPECKHKLQVRISADDIMEPPWKAYNVLKKMDYPYEHIVHSMKDPSIAAFWLFTMPQIMGGFDYDDGVKQKIWWQYKESMRYDQLRDLLAKRKPGWEHLQEALISVDPARAKDDPVIVKNVPYYKAKKTLEAEVMKLNPPPRPHKWGLEELDLPLNASSWSKEDLKNPEKLYEMTVLLSAQQDIAENFLDAQWENKWRQEKMNEMLEEKVRPYLQNMGNAVLTQPIILQNQDDKRTRQRRWWFF